MIKHVILWQLKDEFTEAEKKSIAAEIKSGLESLVGVVPGLVEAHVQTEVVGGSNVDIMLDSTLTDEEALKGYAVHPAHVAVADGKVRPNVKTRLCINYEV